ncbi:MAG: dimethyl sulfoxide reductase anchor subunit family protein [Tropicimonas sp.]|uniref:dimethyl sulfoxide reductase anchor subunit family protein n=1 Tax=Tropicimonas sp. TaxID=2067044 RepID=UPI003A844207
MGWHEWPLMLFTVLAQSAVGAFWLCVLAMFAERRAGADVLRLERLMVVVLAVLGCGFLFSVAHVGSPMRGANAFLRVGRAPLSNELFFGMSFLAAGGLAWLLSCWKSEGTQRLRDGLYLLALLLSVVFLWNMTRFYLMPAVPTWNTPLTPAAFLVTVVLGGAVFANLMFGLSGLSSPRLDRIVTVVATLGLIGGALAAVVLLATLPGIASSVQSASALSPDIGLWQAGRFLLLFAAFGLLLRQNVVHSHVRLTMAAALVLVVCGELIGRGLFYALHMTVGLV